MYDNYNTNNNLLESVVYPGSDAFSIKYAYNSIGALTTITNAKDNSQIWKLSSLKTDGSIEYLSGNVVKTIKNNDIFGAPDAFQVRPVNMTTNLIDIKYNYDHALSTFNSKVDNKNNYSENYQYDNLMRSRLEIFSVNKSSGPLYSTQIQFESNGNIKSKEDVAGNYLYDLPQPHAVNHLESVRSDLSLRQEITYTPFNKVNKISIPTVNSEVDITFNYGPDNQRIKMQITKGTTTVNRIYANNFEKDITGNIERQLSYIYAYGELVALHVNRNENSTTSDSMYYIHTDYQGSIIGISMQNAALKQHRSYDPWGRIRNTDATYDNTVLQVTNRGYTGHEHLLSVDLINMNGRMYDPLLGRMLSPDNYTQAVDMTQNYNRYSYALNNPLKYTDPDGEIIFTALTVLTGQWYLLPVAIGADLGWITGGIRGANTPNMTFWGGAWRGGVVGAIGGSLSYIGGAGMPFAANLALGVVEGAFTGGLDATLWGEDIGKGMMWGAVGGAVFTTLSSENLNNTFKGQGFRTNENVFNRMMAKGYPKNLILDYFGFEGSYNPTIMNPDLEESILGDYFGSANGGDVFGNNGIAYGDRAFSSYDNLKETYYKESFTSLRISRGIDEVDNNLPQGFTRSTEEYKGFIHAYKNHGLYPNSTIDYFKSIDKWGLPIEQSYKPNLLEQYLYSIPRRW